MKFSETYEAADKIELQYAVNVLHECVAQVGTPSAPPKHNFKRVLDIADQITGGYSKAEIEWSEKDVTSEIFKKLFSYMSERTHDNNSEEIKRIIKELIIESSKLYANIVLNEPKVTKEVGKNE